MLSVGKTEKKQRSLVKERDGISMFPNNNIVFVFSIDKFFEILYIININNTS